MNKVKNHTETVQNELEDAYTKFSASNKLMNDESNRLVTWSLSIIGGTILMIVSSSYIQPKGKIVLIYILFIVGWISLGLSIFFGEMLTRIYIAGSYANNNDKERIKKIGLEVQKKFNLQVIFFLVGVITFGLWLISFLIYFILKQG